ncbi:hypothetical protein [Gryllotalpicola protaetiae]|uniref:hypothetical protein n=1 Tax=Gryllotalpicola protaetiae TaxID=2419771 RepID=UPI0013C4D5B2|nr:hypothetical protein [Gryllotalpicola protaetiae]
MNTFVATGEILDPSRVTDGLRAEEDKVLADLHEAGIVRNAYLHEDHRSVTLVLTLPDFSAASAAMSRLPFVQLGIIKFSYATVRSILP